jgi:hypothetical protein
MNVNDVVWVVMRDTFQPINKIFPFKPFKGKFIAEDYDSKLRSMIFVDNDLLSINNKNIFSTEQEAWNRWKSVAKIRIKKIEVDIESLKTEIKKYDFQTPNSEPFFGS